MEVRLSGPLVLIPVKYVKWWWSIDSSKWVKIAQIQPVCLDHGKVKT